MQYQNLHRLNQRHEPSVSWKPAPPVRNLGCPLLWGGGGGASSPRGLPRGVTLTLRPLYTHTHHTDWSKGSNQRSEDNYFISTAAIISLSQWHSLVPTEQRTGELSICCFNKFVLKTGALLSIIQIQPQHKQFPMGEREKGILLNTIKIYHYLQ